MKKRIIALIACVALVSILGICLIACNDDIAKSDANADTYTKKLEKAGYTVESLDVDDVDADIEWGVSATKTKGFLDGFDYVSVIKYTNTDDAKEVEEALIKQLGEDFVYRTGKIVMYGTEQGVKDAK